MNRPNRKSIVTGAVGGLVSVGVVGTLLSYFDYHIVMSPTGFWILVLGAFLLGLISVGFSSHTGLFAPGGGFFLVLAAVVSVELTTPSPQQVGELGGNAIVDGAFHTLSYASTWYLWLTLLLVAGVAEFAIRRGYEYHDDRLRNLPELPLSRYELGILVSGCSVLVGLATTVVLVQGQMWGTISGYGIGFAVATAATAISLTALLSRGIVIPFLLYSWVLTNSLHTEVFTSPDTALHIPFVGIASFGFVVVAALELLVRYRLLGWNGGNFVTDPR
ncbi:hypothetical protein HALLA_04265 (plasmid) [Halostagnicola larsenii XH-48]|uniref:Uncharacterized protein n=1 Tax=Halostagnicola larsenii XH-48 TaxID=797299 RepID=W0JWK0_9EURY|nr:hypothetical protein [Halostagnicola larsenii]AHG01620.1 hypothetical protein HALLA_04265 [Halostagnicola larsenii XH-48]